MWYIFNHYLFPDAWKQSHHFALKRISMFFLTHCSTHLKKKSRNYTSTKIIQTLNFIWSLIISYFFEWQQQVFFLGATQTAHRSLDTRMLHHQQLLNFQNGKITTCVFSKNRNQSLSANSDTFPIQIKFNWGKMNSTYRDDPRPDRCRSWLL